MDGITQQVMGLLTGDHLAKIGELIGANKQATSGALSSALPLLVSALAKNASTPQGADALHQALTKDHNGSILSDVAGFLGNPQAANGAGILGHILGGQQASVTQGLAKSAGLSGGQVGHLLEIAAPLVMGALGHQKQEQGFDAKGLAGFLGGQQQAAHQANPGLLGMLGGASSLGSIAGEVGKLFEK